MFVNVLYRLVKNEPIYVIYIDCYLDKTGTIKHKHLSGSTQIGRFHHTDEEK